MRRYILTAEEFRSLARGYGSPHAIAKLVSGQLAKRRLLISAIAKDVRHIGGEPARIVASAVSVLTAAQAREPQIVRALLAHPQVDAWASRCVRLLRQGDVTPDLMALIEREIGYVCALAATAAIRAGLTFEISVPAAGGAVTLPSLGSVSEFGDGWVHIRGDGTSLSLAGSRGSALVPAPYDVETEHWKPLRHVRVDVAPRLTIAVEDIDQYRDCYQWRITQRLSADEVLRLERLCRRAWQRLLRQHPCHASAMRVAWRSLVPLRRPSLRENYSATSRRTFGAIGLAPPDDPGTLTMLMLHEFQHMKLGALLDMVDLYRPGGVARHEAPWRSDPRPVSALLQGTYAHLAVADFWRVHRQAGDGDVRRAELQFAYWRLQVQAALKSLVASGELTRHGRVFSGHLADTTSAFAAETVSASAQLAAQTCALARSAAWQLTNRQVSQAEVERLARAWRAGEPCPPVEPPLVVAPPSANPGQPRLAELVMGDQDVRAAGSGPDPSPGDTALLAGDPVLAARRYARSISKPVADAASATRNNDMDQWIGLAVSLAINGHGTALVGQLGLIRAAYSALAAEPGGPPSPEALARWCDRPPGTDADPAAAG